MRIKDGVCNLLMSVRLKRRSTWSNSMIPPPKPYSVKNFYLNLDAIILFIGLVNSGSVYGSIHNHVV